jgi:uncharacterized coiled-coil protein SlyX
LAFSDGKRLLMLGMLRSEPSRPEHEIQQLEDAIAQRQEEIARVQQKIERLQA